MTRKKYESDEVHDELWEEEQRRKEEYEQAVYEKALQKEKDRIIPFSIKHFNKLNAMFSDLMNERLNICILNKCKLENFIDFVENSKKYESNSDYYGYQIWLEDTKRELISHYKVLRRSNLFSKITIKEFANFCYSYSGEDPTYEYIMNEEYY